MKQVKNFGEFINEANLVISKDQMAKLHNDGKVEVDGNEIKFADEVINKTANEMLTDAYHKALDEAKTYEADDNADHTLEEYLKEMASLTAEKMYEMYESSCNEMREGVTMEMYEKACNEMKESYAAKMDEMLHKVNESVNYDDIGYRNKSIKSEDDLISVINSFDWGYEMSDSSSTYDRGNRVKDAVRKYIKDKRIKVEKLKPRLSEKGVEVVDRYFK